MKFYSEPSFDSFADQMRENIVSEINSQDDNYILNVNVDDYATYLTQKYLLDTPLLDIDGASVEIVEKNVRGDRFPQYCWVTDTSKSFRMEVLVYHIPYTGDINLLRLYPNPRVLTIYDAKIDEKKHCVLIEVVNLYNDKAQIESKYNQEVNLLTSNYQSIRDACEDFNNNINSFIKESIKNRRVQIARKNNLLLSLGVPIRKKKEVPDTFSIPSPKLKEKITVKPIAHEKDFKPEPALDEENFRKILKYINDVGKNLERLPSTYKGKSEETIRDHIILFLDPHFELGSAGGETFNKTGKTDILIRYDSSVVFVAECKYWKGEKAFLKTIDQLLGYLTWRNSKVAVINFVQNKEFSEVLGKLKAVIKKHSNYLKEQAVSDETWFNYKFHLNGDRNREIDLAVISFHLPK